MAAFGEGGRRLYRVGNPHQEVSALPLVAAAGLTRSKRAASEPKPDSGFGGRANGLVRESIGPGVA